MCAMAEIEGALLEEVRSRFAHVDACPFAGPRAFFENAGGALTLNAVAETSARFAAIPDNQGRDNLASHALGRIIEAGREDVRAFLGADGGEVVVGESGTELLFRLIRAAALGTPAGSVLGTTLEHPASRSAARRWAEVAGKPYVAVPHDDAMGSVEAYAYAERVTPDTRLVTIVHASPVTGMATPMAEIAAAVRAVSPDCVIVVDGIQRAAHGRIDVAAAGVDGYVVSPYKMFSRHGYGVAWLSPRLAAMPLENLAGGPEGAWELGTRDTGAYATFSDVVRYLEWLGGAVGGDGDAPLRAAGRAIHAHEARLTEAMVHGVGNHAGLASLPGVRIVGGADNPRREGVVSFALDGVEAGAIVSGLGERGVRVHIRKADHYSGNVLEPLGLAACVRVSACHYNTPGEVGALLDAMAEIAGA
jgi:selenocysteine lyase/cysteine desulfurase